MKPLDHSSIETVLIYCANMKKMRDFYVETLGCKLAFENPDFAALHVPGGGSISLHSGRSGDLTPTSHIMIELSVKGIEQVRGMLMEQGVEVTPVRDEPFGRICSFRDPEGNLLGLEQN